MSEYEQWLRETLFQHHVLTRTRNPISHRIQWCVCPISDGQIGDPLTYGNTIDEAVENFKNLLEVKE